MCVKIQYLFFWLTSGLGAEDFFKCIHLLFSTQSICQELVNCHICVITFQRVWPNTVSQSLLNHVALFLKWKCLLHRLSRFVYAAHTLLFWNDDCLPITTQFLYILAFSYIRLRKHFGKVIVQNINQLFSKQKSRMQLVDIFHKLFIW